MLALTMVEGLTQVLMVKAMPSGSSGTSTYWEVVRLSALPNVPAT